MNFSDAKQHVGPRQNRDDFGAGSAGQLHIDDDMSAKRRGEEVERVPPAAGEDGRGAATRPHHTRRRRHYRGVEVRSICLPPSSPQATTCSVPIAAGVELACLE